MCDDHAASGLTADAESGLSRRHFLHATAAAGAAAALFRKIPRLPLHSAARPADADGNSAYSMAMHVHSSFSEQSGPRSAWSRPARGRSRSAQPGRSANAAPMTAGRCPCGSSPAASGPIPARTVFTPGLRSRRRISTGKDTGIGHFPSGGCGRRVADRHLHRRHPAGVAGAPGPGRPAGQRRAENHPLPHPARRCPAHPHQRLAASTLTSARPSQRPRKEAPGNAVYCLAR
jgi:hypothetical protein